MYYELIRSRDELVGPEGFLRLPTYIFDEYIFDAHRHMAFRRALESLRARKNVLIIGRAGTGKTAFLAVILKSLMDQGYMVAKIVNGEYVRREHEEHGIFLFFDDLPRAEERTVRSIIENNARMIIATSRIEELDLLRRKIGDEPRRHFEIIEMREMDEEDLLTILNRFASREGIEVEKEAAVIVVRKAMGLPVYIWQVIRDLTATRRMLNLDFARRIPEGMLEYVDKILWDVLGDRDDRREVLLTLMIMTLMPEYEMHQDLFNAVFVEATREIRGVELPPKTILLGSDTLHHICRYLARTPRYSFRLPHDSWADVLRGRSKGLLSSEISSLTFVFPVEEQMRILRRAAKLAYSEAISKSGNPDRVKEFFRQLSLVGIERETIEEKPREIVRRPEKFGEFKDRFIKAIRDAERRIRRMKNSPAFSEIKGIYLGLMEKVRTALEEENPVMYGKGTRHLVEMLAEVFDALAKDAGKMRGDPLESLIKTVRIIRRIRVEYGDIYNEYRSELEELMRIITTLIGS